MKNEKIIIIILVIFLITSASFLFYSENKRLKSIDGDWEIYFEKPKSIDLTFVIKNDGKAKKFHWKEELSKDNSVVSREADILVPAGQKSVVPLLNTALPMQAKLSIEVSTETEKKEIYKFFN